MKFREYVEVFTGLSKNEVLAKAKELGCTIDEYVESTRCIPMYVAVRTPEGRLFKTWFAKKSRRVMGVW